MKTTHQLARELYLLPDVPVVIEYWASIQGHEPTALMTEYDPDGTAIIVQYPVKDSPKKRPSEPRESS